MASATVTDTINGHISSNKVMVFSKSYCPFCNQTKDLLKNKGIEYHAIELDQMSDGTTIQNALKQMTNQNTVPNIFINGEHLGGNSDLVNASNNGTLDTKLA